MNEYSNILALCIKYIEDNLFQDFSLDEMCRHIGYSKYHLSRLFNSKMSISITDYIKSRRLSEAAIMLKTSNDSVIEIAFKCGYNSDDYFIKCFREKFNITPNNYKNGKKFIVITKKYNIEGENKMKFDSVRNLVEYFFKSANNEEELVNAAIKVENCVLGKIDNTDIEIISVLYPEDKREELQLINLNMITGKNSSKRIFKTIEKDVHITDLTKLDDKIEFAFVDEVGKRKNGELLYKKDKTKIHFNISEAKHDK